MRLERDVFVRAVLHDGEGESVVRLVGALLDEDVVARLVLVVADDPLALGAAARTRELEARGRGADGVGIEADRLRGGSLRIRLQRDGKRGERGELRVSFHDSSPFPVTSSCS